MEVIDLIGAAQGQSSQEAVAPSPALAYLSKELRTPATWADVLAALGSIRAELEQERAGRELAEALLRKERAKVAELSHSTEGIRLWGQGWLESYQDAAARAARAEARLERMAAEAQLLKMQRDTWRSTALHGTAECLCEEIDPADQPCLTCEGIAYKKEVVRADQT